jgi:1-acyl-sn-glycerol-3-phosphate acyltransferase
MSKKKIDRFSIRYRIVKTYVMVCHRIFYRRLQAKFRHRIPRDRSVLLAPNHQNALMDAMAPLMTSRRDPIFLTRADVFKKKIFADIFRLFKMLPVYRIRDGAGELSKNEDIFNESVDIILRKKCPVAIFPEGNHGDKRRLRPLVKGIFRIAFKAQETYGNEPGVVIVPVGMDYSAYSNFRGNLFIQYGEPVEVSEYFSEYQENQARAINRLRERLSEEMKKYIINIPSEDHYHTYMLLRQILNPGMRKRLGFRKKDQYHRLLADQHMIGQLSKLEEEQPDKMAPLSDLAIEYMRGLKKLGLRDWVFRRKRHSLLLLLMADLGMVLLFPIFICGAVLNIAIYELCKFAGSKIRDTQFQSTVKFLTGVILFPLWYLILFILAWIFTDPAWIKWALLASIPFMGLLAHTWYIWFKKLRSLWKYQILTLGRNKQLLRLKAVREQILEMAGSLIPA